MMLPTSTFTRCFVRCCCKAEWLSKTIRKNGRYGVKVEQKGMRVAIKFGLVIHMKKGEMLMALRKLVSAMK